MARACHPSRAQFEYHFVQTILSACLMPSSTVMAVYVVVYVGLNKFSEFELSDTGETIC